MKMTLLEEAKQRKCETEAKTATTRGRMRRRKWQKRRRPRRRRRSLSQQKSRWGRRKLLQRRQPSQFLDIEGKVEKVTRHKILLLLQWQYDQSREQSQASSAKEDSFWGCYCWCFNVWGSSEDVQGVNWAIIQLLYSCGCPVLLYNLAFYTKSVSYHTKYFIPTKIAGLHL